VEDYAADRFPHVLPRARGVARHDFDDLLAGNALRAVFQPLVDLTSGEVVGYEALVRRLAGTELERPDALFARGRAEGRLGELDWACRAAAIRGALEAGLRAPPRLFVNMEPEALGVPCPGHLRTVWPARMDSRWWWRSRSGR